jgi:hypothetical protein
VLPQAAYSGEAKAPESIIQEEKKRVRSLMSAFMKIRPAIGFSRRDIDGGNWRVSRIIAGTK